MSSTAVRGNTAHHRTCLSAPVPAPVILVVEEDWRARRFIRTVLTYAAGARVIDAPAVEPALAAARALERPVDMLIAAAGSAATLARALTPANPAMRVLLLTRDRLPSAETPPAWRCLRVPFATAALLDCLTGLAAG